MRCHTSNSTVWWRYLHRAVRAKKHAILSRAAPHPLTMVIVADARFARRVHGGNSGTDETMVRKAHTERRRAAMGGTCS